MNDTERLVFVTRSFNRLQNLRLALFYLLFIVSPWINLHRVSAPVGFVALGVCIVWYVLLKIYYKRRYGQIDGKSTPERGVSRFFAVLAFFYLMTYLAGRFGSSPELWLLAIPGYVLAEAAFPHNIALRRSYYIAAGVVLLVVLLPGLFRGMPGRQFFHVYDFTFYGAVLLILGILDHILLTCSFHQPSGENYV